MGLCAIGMKRQGASVIETLCALEETEDSFGLLESAHVVSGDRAYVTATGEPAGHVPASNRHLIERRDEDGSVERIVGPAAGYKAVLEHEAELLTEFESGSAIDGYLIAEEVAFASGWGSTLATILSAAYPETPIYVAGVLPMHAWAERAAATELNALSTVVESCFLLDSTQWGQEELSETALEVVRRLYAPLSAMITGGEPKLEPVLTHALTEHEHVIGGWSFADPDESGAFDLPAALEACVQTCSVDCDLGAATQVTVLTIASAPDYPETDALESWLRERVPEGVSSGQAHWSVPAEGLEVYLLLSGVEDADRIAHIRRLEA